ncbi:MAG: hypothetical protein PWQ37_1906 [Candidatus Petromonas sp.]|nr:hypothetical protein [Thermoanaerobacterium sp.]MDK2919173.1 hypothetical protein [Candidatus Petromonas sp.]
MKALREALKNELKAQLTPDLIPHPYNEWAKIVGSENLYEFVEKYGGTTAYIPKSDYLIREVRDNLIRQEYKKGCSYQELMEKYKLSERWIRIICENKEEK